MIIDAYRGFRAAQLRLGARTMSVIGPISGWTLPTGYTYQRATDRIQNATGTVLTPSATHYSGVTTSVSYVPTAVSQELRQLVTAGIVPDGTIDVMIPAANVAAVRAAWAVQIGSNFYRVGSISEMPYGDADVARIRLERRT